MDISHGHEGSRYRARASSELISSDDMIYVAGHRGMVGSAVWRRLAAQGFDRLIGATSSELDLRRAEAVEEFFAANKPDVVVLAAAKVGGILANATYPADFLSDNLRIQLNVMDAALRHGVRRLLFLGSSCIYPKHAPQPIPESALLTGPLEQTNDGYAIAKIAGIMQVQAIRRQHNVPWISAMPTNLYGPGDNFDLKFSHVLPAMLRKFHDAKVEARHNVTLWGSGTPRREFLHVDDLAAASVFLLQHYNEAEHINIGSGVDVAISDLAGEVRDAVGYDGHIDWDVTMPDGTPRKLLDVSRLTGMGWKPEISLGDGVAATYRWFLDHPEARRG
ncbi:GDP-L-fucose synthase [Actinoplanes sp. NBC_00393]|uniref:GDP-L-fucose synthase family protein n=1 Tax=Actinoplanes sp. NBC_00393 TaxID=2975953 RepID=UPI002E1FD6E4